MRYLLDTHCFLWHFSAPARLSQAAADILMDESNDLHLSVASICELVIKVSIGKLSLPEPVASFVDTRIALLSCGTLDITRDHMGELATLPMHHRDPFDRLLIAQARAENLTIITSDHVFDAYDVPKVSAG